MRPRPEKRPLLPLSLHCWLLAGLTGPAVVGEPRPSAKHGKLNGPPMEEGTYGLGEAYFRLMEGKVMEELLDLSSSFIVDYWIHLIVVMAALMTLYFIYRKPISKKVEKDSYAAPIPHNEEARLSELHDLNILDTDPEAMYDEVTKLAARFFDMPISLISLVDRDRQWFKSKVGLEPDQTPRDISLCQYAILEPKEVFVVEDAHLDDRFGKEHPLVQGYPKLRFYAGAPLVTENGNALGTLCIIDQKPRKLSKLQEQMLVMMAKNISSKFKTLNPSLHRIDAPLLVLRKSGRIVFANEDAELFYMGESKEHCQVDDPKPREEKKVDQDDEEQSHEGGEEGRARRPSGVNKGKSLHLLVAKNIRDLVNPKENAQLGRYLHSFLSFKKQSSNGRIFTMIDRNGTSYRKELWLGKTNYKPQDSKNTGSILCVLRDVVLSSRYENDFEEISTLGHGSFGSVRKCRNKMDGQVYAIKIIKVKEVTPSRPAKTVAGGDAVPKNSESKTTEEDLGVPLVHKEVLGADSGAPATENPVMLLPDASEEMERDKKDNGVGQGEQKREQEEEPEVDDDKEDGSSSTDPTIYLASEGKMHSANHFRIPEAGVLASVCQAHHPNVAAYYASWRERDSHGQESLFIQMQYCGPLTLRGYFDKMVNQPADSNSSYIRSRMMIALQLAEGLDHIHQSGFIHRDIKPANIFLQVIKDNTKVEARQLSWLHSAYFVDCESYWVKIGDFGLATSHDKMQTQVHHTRGVGTQLYAAPEQLYSTDYTEKVDLYALGLVLCSLFCPRNMASAKERHNYLRGLREGKEIECKNEAVKKLLSRMISVVPGARPTCDVVKRQLVNIVKNCSTWVWRNSTLDSIESRRVRDRLSTDSIDSRNRSSLEVSE